MKEKIDWYQEVLELEPGSKVFFPLARLLAEAGQIEKAVRTLRLGLDRHPEFMEARLYFIDLLFKIGEADLCNEQLESLAPLFARYAGFWQAWSKTAGKGAYDDSNIALAFLAAVFRHGPLTLGEVLARGLRDVQGEDLSGGTLERAPVRGAREGASAAAPPRDSSSGPGSSFASLRAASSSGPEGAAIQEGDGETEEQEEERFSLRTRSMAEVLAEQGDFVGALEIYRELEAAAASPEEAAELQHRISRLTALLGAAQEQSPALESAVETQSGKHRVLSVLEALAERLETRVHG